MWTFSVKRLKRIEELLTEAEKINGPEQDPRKKADPEKPMVSTTTPSPKFSTPTLTSKEPVNIIPRMEPPPKPEEPSSKEETQPEQIEPDKSQSSIDSEIKKYDALLDKFMSTALDEQGFTDVEIRQAKNIIESYLDFCKYRLSQISEQLKGLLSQPGSPQNEIKSLADQQFDIATKISTLEGIYLEVKDRPDAEIQQIVEEVIKKIDEVQQFLSNEYMDAIESAGKRNYELLQRLESAKSEGEKREIAKEIVNSWQELNIVTDHLDEPSKTSLAQAQNQTYDRVSSSIGRDQLDYLVQGASLNREEADLISRIVKLNYTTFTTEEEIVREFKEIRTKVNSLKGSSKFKAETSPETIKYLTQMVDIAEVSVYRKFKDKSIELSKAKGIRYDYDIQLKMYERIPLPVTGKQIADSSSIMKFRTGLQSLLSLLFGGSPKTTTPEGEAWAGFGSKIHNIYAKTLNTVAKTAGRLVGGRAGELAGDALSRLFIPNTGVLDVKKSRSIFEEATAPGLANQVPGSIGSMGDIVAPTPTSIGSGDNFSPRKKSAKKKKILEFKEFVSQFLK